MYIIIIYLQCWLDSTIYAGHSEIFVPEALGWHPVEWTARRQRNPIQQYLGMEKAKKMSKAPYQGYEPYWEGYESHLEERPLVTGPNHACGEECHIMYIEYGEICGRGNNYTHKTFENYCQLLNEDCSGGEKWMIAYRGKCMQNTLKPYPTKRADFIERAKKYHTAFSERNPATRKSDAAVLLQYRTFSPPS